MRYAGVRATAAGPHSWGWDRERQSAREMTQVKHNST